MNWKPGSQAQEKALNCRAELLLFGGAAGSLKSETILVDAVQEYDNPKLTAIILRRTYPELKQLIQRSRSIYAELGGTYNSTDKQWTWPWGSTVMFASSERDDDIFKYLGQEYSYIAFDESTYHSEFQVRYLLSRLRSTDPSLKLRSRLATNPGGPGHKWHKDMFLGGRCPHCQPAVRMPEQLYADAVWPSDKKRVEMTTCFIPGKVTDHTLLPDYARRLNMQQGAFATALLEGCWEAFEGMYYDIFNPSTMIVPRQMIDAQYWWPHWIGADYGFSGSAAVAHLFATSPDGTIYCLSEYCAEHEDVRTWARRVAERFALKNESDTQAKRLQAMWLSPDMWNDRGDMNTLADQMNEVLDQYGLGWVKASNDRAGGAMLIYTLLQQGRLKIADTCPMIIESLPSRIHDEDEPEKVFKAVGDSLDDAFDSFRYGLYSYEQAGKEPFAEKLHRLEARLQSEELTPTQAMIARRRLEVEATKESGPCFVGGRAAAKAKIWRAGRAARHYSRI